MSAANPLVGVILQEESIVVTKGYYMLSMKTKIKVMLESSKIKNTIYFAITISIE